MPRLSKDQLENRAQVLKNLYVKHKGNKRQMAKELGITPSAMTHRFRSAPGLNIEQDYNTQLQKTARKLGITIEWYLKQLLEGATKSNKIVGYLQKHKREGGVVEKIEPDQSISNEFIEVPDRAVRHKYLVTLGEVMKYLNRNGIDVKTQVFVGSNVSSLIHTATQTQTKSDEIED